MSDLLVVLGCALMYAAPDLWPAFRRAASPLMLPYELPIVQVKKRPVGLCRPIERDGTSISALILPQ